MILKIDYFEKIHYIFEEESLNLTKYFFVDPVKNLIENITSFIFYIPTHLKAEELIIKLETNQENFEFNVYNEIHIIFKYINK